MNVCNSPGIFQEKIYKIFEGLYMVSLYIYYLLVITRDDFEDNLKSLGKFLYKIVETGIKLNTEKSFLG